MINRIIVYLLVSITFFSCEEILLKEKEVFLKKVTPFDFYESANIVNVDNSGITLSINKSETDGDTTKCELFLRSLNYKVKVDFDGNIIKQSNIIPSQINTQIDNSAIFINGFYYKCFSGDKPRLVKYNSDGFEIEAKPLDYKKFTNIGFYPENIIHVRDEIFVSYNLPIVENRKGVYIYKQQFCIISMQNGVEKLILDGTEIIGDYTMIYYLNNNNELMGLLYRSRNDIREFNVLSRKYNLDFKLIKSENYQIKEVLNIEKIWFNKIDENIILIGGNYVKNQKMGVKVDRNLILDQKFLGEGSIYFNFLNTNSQKLLYVTYNNTDKNQTIAQLKEDFTSAILSNIPYNFPLQYLNEINGNYEFYGIGYGNNFKKPSIEFQKIDSKGVFTKKKLFESQYARNCYRLD